MKIFSLTVCLLSFSLIAYTQTLNIHINGGTVQSFSLSEIDSITFTISSCPATVQYQGKAYNTVLIGNQCWLKENLNVGTLIQVNQNASNNGVIEKYCYDNDPSNCNIYGGLYLWDEVMQYSTNEGAQGICPSGWHLPTKAEFEALITLANDSSDGLLEVGQRTGATNSTGFSALLAGHRRDNSVFFPPYYAHFWSSLKFDGANSYYLLIDYPNDGSVSATSYLPNAFGLQIRCVKN